MKIPTTLKHKPVIVVEDYDRMDSDYIDSDAKGLSLGLAQWNDRGKVEISAKVWRYTGEKWSRQSEELPLHRVLDLAILIAKSSQYFREAYRMPKLYDENNPTMGKLPVQGDGMKIDICTDNPMLDEDIQLFRDTLHGKNDERLGERLAVLAGILKEMGY